MVLSLTDGLIVLRRSKAAGCDPPEHCPLSTRLRHITLRVRWGDRPSPRGVVYSRSRVGSQMLGRIMLFMRKEEMGMQMM